MQIDTFLESLHIHHNDPITVVYPRKSNLEDYALYLDYEYSQKYKCNLHNVRYIDYYNYKQQNNIPGFTLDGLYIVDPRCYIQELIRYDLFFEEVRKLWKKL